MAYHEGRLLSDPSGSTAARDADYGGYDWLLASDQWGLFRSDRVRQATGGGVWRSSLDLTINYGDSGGQYSDWAVAAALMYNCNLTAAEIKQVRVPSVHVSCGVPARCLGSACLGRW